MFLDEWKTKPKNGKYILINVWGNVDNYKICEPKKWDTAKNKTNIIVTVYCMQTDRMSDKTVYVSRYKNKPNRLYIKTLSYGRLWLDEFI